MKNEELLNSFACLSFPQQHSLSKAMSESNGSLLGLQPSFTKLMRGDNLCCGHGQSAFLPIFELNVALAMSCTSSLHYHPILIITQLPTSETHLILGLIKRIATSTNPSGNLTRSSKVKSCWQHQSVSQKSELAICRSTLLRCGLQITCTSLATEKNQRSVHFQTLAADRVAASGAPWQAFTRALFICSTEL